jgi:hypothetical protein
MLSGREADGPSDGYSERVGSLWHWSLAKTAGGGGGVRCQKSPCRSQV